MRSSDDRFKAVAFGLGLNILVADKTATSTTTDSRNSAGKSSLVEILHYVLGMGRLTDSVLANGALREDVFTLVLDWPGLTEPATAARSLKSRSRSKVGVSPDVTGGVETLPTFARDVPVAEWLAAIGASLFGLPEEHPGVSVRGLLSFYARRVSQHGFDDPVQTFSRQSVTEASSNVAYLLGLDWRLAAGYQSLAAREAVRKKLREAIKDPGFKLVVGAVSELRGQVTAAKARVRSLQEQVGAFQVVPEYERLQAEADAVDEQIRTLRSTDAADRRNILDLEAAIRDEDEPDVNYVERIYRELGVELPGAVLRTYDDVRVFHDSVIANRRTYLQDELEATRGRLDERQRSRDSLGERHAALLQTLEQGGALAAFTALQQQMSAAQTELGTLQSRLDTAVQLEATQAEIRLERGKLQQAISRDLGEREETVTEINTLFQRFATTLYGAERDAWVEITALETSLRIDPHIGGEDSQGVGKMVTFCFDLMTAVVARRGGRGPDFLVHDSHLFDGVDERQVAKALSLAREVCSEEDLQYVVTMNSDDLDKAERHGAGVADCIIEPRLTDEYDTGGIFGFRFG
ncbi:ABC-three component system protein [Ruania alba]|uniref:ABC-three component system protein n=1 Tax=Ruania alba TaxID=648782 RepID=UPI001FDEA769|nr:ABC-three component system protein [Ruania alba]